MKIQSNSTIADIVSENFKTADIFKKYKIDFCCGGDKSIDKVCQEKGIPREDLLSELSIYLKPADDENDYKNWDPVRLIDHIEKKHHRYVERSLPLLRDYLAKVDSAHGANHPEVVKIRELFNASADELTKHMKKEELMLFPYIKQMWNAQQNNTEVNTPPYGTVKNPIQMMELEHDTEGGRFDEIQKLSDNFTPPEDACNTYKVTYYKLQEFQEDLHTHIHLENNILFPMALEMEEELAKKKK